MKSLRGRLLLVTLIVIAVLWFVSSCMYVAHVTREQSGWLDNSLRDIAHQVLTSLPEDIALLAPGSTPLSIADRSGNTEPGPTKMSFQIWALPDTLLLRSMESPHAALRADFGDGFGIEEINGREWRVYAVTDATGRFQVQTAMSMDLVRAYFWRSTKLALLVAVLVFLVLGGTLWKVIWKSMRPVTRLQHDIAARQEYDLAPLPSAGVPCEIQPLIESFNRLLVRIDRAINNERRFIADAAHELRTPLAAVQAHAQVALQSSNPEETRAALNRVIAAVERGTRMAQQLLDSARLESGHAGRHEVLDLAEIASMVTHEFDATARQRRQTITLNADSCHVLGDVDELGILVRNLLDNALRYSGEGSRIEVDCCMDDDHDGATLRVRDNGPGIPDENERSRIFERFFRASGNGQRGSGVGLSLVRRIAESHDAGIEMLYGLENDRQGSGLSISITFPAVHH